MRPHFRFEDLEIWQFCVEIASRSSPFTNCAEQLRRNATQRMRNKAGCRMRRCLRALALGLFGTSEIDAVCWLNCDVLSSEDYCSVTIPQDSLRAKSWRFALCSFALCRSCRLSSS